MRVFADRFVIDGIGACDLATGQEVRLTIIERAERADARLHAAVCDQLCRLRHPLLYPLLDYGFAGTCWFEAHAALPPLQLRKEHVGRAALHLVRFLQNENVALSSGSVDRHVRLTADSSSTWPRPIGVRLQTRASLEAIRFALEAHGPPGVTPVTICGEQGAGLRTARLELARAARLAGFVPLDRAIADTRVSSAIAAERHLCVFEWVGADRRVPARLMDSVSRHARRHLWIRFRREPDPSTSGVVLEPLSISELTAMIYADSELGPTSQEIAAASRRAAGLPAELLRALGQSADRAATGAWVHETAPEYRVEPEPGIRVLATKTAAGGGITRLQHVVSAARSLAERGRHARAARLLSRAAEALAARGALHEAALAACDLGELRLRRARPDAALESFARARAWSTEDALQRRCLRGCAEALIDAGRLADAEGTCRTLLALAGEASADDRRLLAEVHFLRGDLEAARGTLLSASHGADARGLALAAHVERRRGNLGEAGKLAAAALKGATDGLAACEAHLALAYVHAALGDDEGAARHAAAAVELAARARVPAQRVRAAAAREECAVMCGQPIPSARHRRLVAAASKLPPLRAAEIRAMLQGPDEEVQRFARAAGALVLLGTKRTGLVHAMESILTIVDEAPDEQSGLTALARHVLDSLNAASVTIRASTPARQVAAAGRSWPGDEQLSERVINAGCWLFRDGVAPEAAEPIKTGGLTLGCIAARWGAGGNPAATGAHEQLRIAAAVAGPLLRQVLRPVDSAQAPLHPDDLLGPGAAATQVRQAIARAALAPYPVLVEGESGSGKELVARAIHARSPRRGRRFCAVNCAAFNDELLEAELFGHARGAFTGAVAERHGLFEEAHEGTLLLDEVAELSPRAQAKLLRVLQDGEVRRIGENMPRRVDTRIVAASNRPLPGEVDAGRFRADLRFRLDVIRIHIPPLRERPEDVPWLAERLWHEASGRVGTHAILPPEVIASLARYDWPGNVRELQNVIAALAVHAPRRGRVAASLLPAHIASLAGRHAATFERARLDFERRFVRAALARAGGRKATAAQQLGVSRQGLSKMLKRLGIAESC